MLIAMNPFIGFIYQIFKGLAWLITRRWFISELPYRKWRLLAI
jgi:hypothetical protein